VATSLAQLRRRAGHEQLLVLDDLHELLLGGVDSEVLGLDAGGAADFLEDLRELLLVHDDTVGLGEQLVENGQASDARLATRTVCILDEHVVHRVPVLVLHLIVERARAVERGEGR
jgi:hypothetical protein